MKGPEFRPQRGLRSPHVQSVLASGGLRRWLNRHRHQTLLQRAESRIINAGNGVRLQGELSKQAQPSTRGLAILLHGWEGSTASTYMLHTGAELYQRGFDVFRLNFRDHGASHHLNPELFHSCRLDEVVGAVRQIAAELAPNRLFIAGFSLGGNFALRVALKAPENGIALTHAIAVCPVINPHHGLDAIERAPWFYEKYFVRKWRRSLKQKAALFPHHFDFSHWHRTSSLRELTRLLVSAHTEFPSMEAYLDGYSIAGARLRELAIPSTILTAKDDPIIPVSDFESLELSAQVELEIAPFGGHCGFIRDYRLNSWVEHFIAARFERACIP
jgi:uncharacterized protein